MTRTLDADGRPGEAPDGRPGRDEPAAPASEGLDRIRILVAGAMGSVILSYALLVPAAAGVVLTAGGGMSIDGAFAAAIPLWLAAHRIPLSLGDHPLSVLPLLPTVVIGLVVALGAAWTARRLGGSLRTEAGAVLASIAGTHSAVAVLGSALLPRSTEVAAAPWAALVASGLVAGCSAAVGLVRECGVPRLVLDRVPPWAPAAARAAGIGFAALATAGALTLAAGMVLAADDVAAAYARLAPTAGAGIGVTLLAWAYLPNAVIAAVSWLAGPGIAVGTAAASPFGVTTGAPATFPLLAALPTGTPPPFAPLALLVPALIGVLVGVTARRSGRDAPWVALAGSGAVVLGYGVLALLAGGRLAAGPYDPVSVPALLLVPALLVLVTGPAMLVAVLGRSAGVPELGALLRRRAQREDPYEYEEDYLPASRPDDSRRTTRADDPADDLADDLDDEQPDDPDEQLADGYEPVEPDADATPAKAGADESGADRTPPGSRSTADRAGGGRGPRAGGGDDPAEDDPADDPHADDAHVAGGGDDPHSDGPHADDAHTDGGGDDRGTTGRDAADREAGGGRGAAEPGAAPVDAETVGADRGADPLDADAEPSSDSGSPEPRDGEARRERSGTRPAGSRRPADGRTVRRGRGSQDTRPARERPVRQRPSTASSGRDAASGRPAPETPSGRATSGTRSGSPGARSGRPAPEQQDTGGGRSRWGVGRLLGGLAGAVGRQGPEKARGGEQVRRPAVEPSRRGDSAEPSRRPAAEPLRRGEAGAATPAPDAGAATPDEPKPRTVADLVAQRAREAEAQTRAGDDDGA